MEWISLIVSKSYPKDRKVQKWLERKEQIPGNILVISEKSRWCAKALEIKGLRVLRVRSHQEAIGLSDIVIFFFDGKDEGTQNMIKVAKMPGMNKTIMVEEDLSVL